MIFYFTGTGNSKYAADRVAEALNDKVIFIPEAWRKKEFSYKIKDGEKIGIVYPVHSWAPPTIVKRFIRKLKIECNSTPYVYSILTCAGEWQGAFEHLRRCLEKAGLTLNGVYSIFMPNNYVIAGELPEEKIVKEKLEAADIKIDKIITQIKENSLNYTKQKYSFFKSHVMYSFFQISKMLKLFKADDSCIGCGLCEKVCPMKAIVMKEYKDKDGKVRRKPEWTRKCVQCTGCINVCPKKAINFLSVTKGRRRYFNPYYKKEIVKKK